MGSWNKTLAICRKGRCRGAVLPRPERSLDMKNSSDSALLPPKPTGLRKWVYALHLGWLFDHKFLLLTHRGRKTGLIRRSVIAVMLYDRRKQESMVLAGYGKDSDWYRNLQAHPALEIQTGFRRYRPTQRFLTEEVYALLARFAHCTHSFRLARG